jgi:peptidoglycan/LPS O-acetylase OafA/YrhL
MAHDAVMVFFVISGFLVGGKLRHAAKPGFLKHYMLDRATRIYVVALPVLLLSYLAMSGQRWLFGHAVRLNPGICESGLGDLASALVMAHKGFGARYCFNSPIWSLVYEVFYYVFFCLLALAWARRGSAAGRWAALGAALLGVYGYFATGPLYPLATLWLLGAAAAQAEPLKGRGLAVTLTVLALLFGQAIVREGYAWREVAVALATVVSILWLKRREAMRVPEWIALCASGGAAFSYSLYLAHAPAMNFARAIANQAGVRLGTMEVNATTLIAWLLFTLLGLASGLLIWWLFERHTMALRAAVKRLLIAPAEPAPAPLEERAAG